MPSSSRAVIASTVFFVALVGLVGLSEMYRHQMMLADAVLESDIHMPPPDWDPHRLGICMTLTSPKTTKLAHVHDAMRRVKRLYPHAPVFVHSDHPFAYNQTTSRLNECIRLAAQTTQVVVLMNERTWMLRPTPVVLDGTVGMVGHRRTAFVPSPVDRAKCPNAHADEPILIPTSGSLILSSWVRDKWRLEGPSISYDVWCMGDHVSVDANLVRNVREDDVDGIALMHGDVSFIQT